jgi:HlyD family secretion protein
LRSRACPGSPRERQGANVKKIVVAVLVLAAVGAAAAWYYWPRTTGPEVVRLPGTVEVQEVRLGSKVGGRVTAVQVREGQIVEAGTELVRFETQELIARRDQAKHKLAAARATSEKANKGPLEEEIAEAKAAADAAKARLALANAGYREERKKQVQADLVAAEAELKKAEDNYTRVFGLVGSSTQERDVAQAARDRARALLASAKATAEWMSRGNRPEEIEEAKAESERYTARYQFLRRGTRDEDKAIAYAAVEEAEARLVEAETQLREALVVAPEKCRIEVLSVRAGDLVTAGQPVVRAHRADDLWVKAFVPSTDLGKLKHGQAVEVAVDSHPGKRFTGEVMFIASVSEFTPRNVQSADERKHQVFAVKVRVNDPDGVFKSGMAAEVFVPLAN